MKKDITSTILGLACACSSLFFFSCSSEVDDLNIPEGKGFVKIDLTPEVGFRTKAVSESDYEAVDNYTVQVYKAGNEKNLIIDDKYKNLDDKYTLSIGNYVLKAFMGEDKAVSSDVLYFSGESAFKVEEGKEASASVTCKPSSARINVAFDETMDEYFSDYSLKIETEAQKPSSFEWNKKTAGPLYFKVGQEEQVKVTVKLTNKENVTTKTKEIVKTYTLSPADALKITLKPVVSNGTLGITITIDDKTTDHPVDIIIPSEWI